MTIVVRRSAMRYVSGTPSCPPPSIGDNSATTCATYDATDKGDLRDFFLAGRQCTDLRSKSSFELILFPTLTAKSWTRYTLFTIVNETVWKKKDEELYLTRVFYIFPWQRNTPDRYRV